MPLESIIEHYGYLAIGVGTFFEGETILVLGGFLSHRGYLLLHWVILAAFVGSLAGDQLLFFLGRRHGAYVLGKRPSWNAKVERVNAKLHRYHTMLIIGFRFFYGFRTVTPFVLGMSPVSRVRFLILNATGALLWAVSIGTGGYLFGQALEVVLGDIRRYEIGAIVGICTVGAALWLTHQVRRRRKGHKTGQSR
jgi:membrane protein DedA with SNARE-associated domain